MDPINYQVADPSAAILNGVKLAGGLQTMQQQAQQQQLTQQQALQTQRDLSTLAMNPNATHADYAAMMTKYPALAENLGKAFKVLDDGQQQNALQFGSRVYSSLLAGNNDLAEQMMRDKAKASTDPQQAQHYTTMADLVQHSPQTARTIGALSLAGAMGPDKFATAFTNLGTDARAEQKQPAEVAQAQALAAKTGAEATQEQFKADAAPITTPLGIQKTQEEILSAQAQRRVADFNSQIQAANSETERGRLTLERDKFIADQKLKTGQVAQDTQGQFDNITQSLDLVRSLRGEMKKNRGSVGTLLSAAIPGLDTGPGVGTSLGKLLGYVPGTDAKDFNAKLETLKSQQFLAQAKEMKGMGALSDAEGARIERAVASLDRDQSPQAFDNALGVIEATLAKGHAKLVASGKLPQAGGAFVMRHPQFGNVTDADVNRLMAQNPGATRDQVLQFLRSTGGK